MSICLGCTISLLSKSENRYEGILYSVDVKESTVSLAKVKTFGTENRRPPKGIVIPPRDEVYEYIIFGIDDIKDLHVKSGPQQPPVLASGLPNDPAILQVLHSPVTPRLQLGQTLPMNLPMPFQQLQNQMEYVQPMFTGYSSSNRSAPPQTSQRKHTTDAGVQVSQPTESSENKGPKGRSRESARISFAENTQTRTTNQQRGYFPNRRFQRERGQRRGRGGRRGGAFIRSQEPLKFDCEYDFELANAEFIELENKLSKNLPEKTEDDNEEMDDSLAYDKAKSFYDNISCEASRSAKGIPRFDWRVEKKLNVETFGVPVSANWLRRRRGRGGFRRGGRGRGAPVSSIKTESDASKTVAFGEQVVTAEIERPETPMEASKPEDIPVIELVEPKEVWVESSEADKEQWK